MSTVEEIHDKAMELAQRALIARHSGDYARAQSLASEALVYEAEAANMVPYDVSSEPTRSILYHSAASLAYQSRQFDRAMQLIGQGLAGFPPAQIRQDLKDLWEQINFEEHLQVRGVELAPNDLQVSLQGDSVGSGMIPYREFQQRINAIYGITTRTVQRLLGRRYQRTGRIAEMYRYFTPSLSVPRLGSFAITFRLGVPSEHQTNLFINADQVIDEVIVGMSYVNEGDNNSLRNLINNESYYLSFLSHARKLVPDGERINFVGLTSLKNKIGITKRVQDVSLAPEYLIPGTVEQKQIELEGILDYAEARRVDRIGLTTDENKNYTIIVKEGMDDLVRSYFDQRVRVIGVTDGRSIMLLDVEPLEE
jgi:hypothetical protein